MDQNFYPVPGVPIKEAAIRQPWSDPEEESSLLEGLTVKKIKASTFKWNPQGLQGKILFRRGLPHI